ncbi:MAG: 4Fe-4S binding protein [Eubacteriales bacterium]
MRHFFQLGFFALSNGYFLGFFKGNIYQGSTKQLCFPGLNCYSCPSAMGACPVGAVQATLTGASKSIPFYALGFLLFFGVVLGRGVCALCCPFGLVQELLHKLRPKKWKKTISLPNIFRKVPYFVLGIFVIALPILVTNKFGLSSPAFCKWICPSGTLFGGIPLLLVNESLRGSVSNLFYWKFSLLITISLWSVAEYRPFCKYLCPLGVFYGLFQSFSLYRMKFEKSSCIGCESCHSACKMGVKVTETPNSTQCVRCGDCVGVCPTNSLKLGFSEGKSTEQAIE